MTDDFRKGLITGMATQPLQITTEHANSDKPYNPFPITFKNHNILSDGFMIDAVDWHEQPINGVITVNTVGEDVVCFADDNPTTVWCCISNAIQLKTNRLYKLTSNQTFNGYGRIGVSTYSSSVDIYDPYYKAGKNAACVKPLNVDWNAIINADVIQADNFMLFGSSYRQTSYFIPIPRNPGDITQSTWIWFCGDRLYNDQRAAHSFNLSLHEQEF